MGQVRILQVVTIMNRGGAETLLMNLYRNIDRNKIQFDFLTHRLEEGAYDEEIKSLGGKVFHLPPIRPTRYKKYFKELDSFFLQHPEYKIVHSHINENSSFVLRAAKKADVPVRIAHSHMSNLPIDYKLPFRYYARHFLRGNATHYFACSTEAGKWLFDAYIVNSNKVVMLKNGVDYESFKFNDEIRHRLRHELGLEDKFVVGHVGRFEPQKNHSFLIDVFREVKFQKPDSILLLVGSGKLKNDIEKKVDKLGLGESVKFLGVRSDIPQLMQAMDVFLFPSVFEGLPVALVEAQAAGLSCIISDSITSQSDIAAGLVNSVSLKEAKSTWVDKIINTNLSHINSKEALNKSGFNIVEISKSLQDFYLNLYKD